MQDKFIQITSHNGYLYGLTEKGYLYKGSYSYHNEWQWELVSEGIFHV